MRLTDVVVRNAKPNGNKITRLWDKGGSGLYLEVTPNGRKGWRKKFYYNGREKRISLGIYPNIKLAKARRLSNQAQELLDAGINPSEQRRINKLQGLENNENTFRAVAERWFDSRKIDWSEGYQRKVSQILDQKLFRWIGNTPIKEVTPPKLLEALRHIERQGKLDTAMTTKQIASQVFCYGVAEGWAERDITLDIKGALKAPKTKHRASITEPKEVGKLLLAIDAYEGTEEVCYALRLAPLTFVRPGELRNLEWKEIDWENKVWCIGAEKMKMERDHYVPLSKQSLKILRSCCGITGKYRYAFPNARSPNGERPMSDNALRIALRTMGYTKEQMTPHGFRAMARTLLDEKLRCRPDWIEHQLAHAVKDPLGRAYNRTTHLEDRHKMMQQWADYLDKLKKEAQAG